MKTCTSSSPSFNNYQCLVILVSSICPSTISPLQWKPHSNTPKTSYLIQKKIHNFFQWHTNVLSFPHLPVPSCSLSATLASSYFSHTSDCSCLRAFAPDSSAWKAYSPTHQTSSQPACSPSSSRSFSKVSYSLVLLITYTWQESNTALPFGILRLAAESRSLKVCATIPQLLIFL